MTVVIYSKAHCPYCDKAKALLKANQVDFSEYRIDQSAEHLHDMQRLAPGARTVPQIFVGDYHVGGCDDLYALHAKQPIAEFVNQQSQKG